MKILRTESDVHAFVGRSGPGCVLVPTMGALHVGHASLVRAGATLAADRGLAAGCVVTIFVNPTQFNDPADFDRYPKTLDADVDLCDEAGATAVFVPEPEVIYPPNTAIMTPTLPDAATRPQLEDRFRPGHFAGVCQVVKRLFDLVPSRAAIFGEKDWQQLQVVRAMVKGAGLPTEIVGVPTVRDADGLAMSSRNRFLRPEERRAALSLSMAIRRASAEPNAAAAEQAMAAEIAGAGAQVEYSVIRDAETLLEPAAPRPARAIIAARVGTVRLLDNAAWTAAAATARTPGVGAARR